MGLLRFGALRDRRVLVVPPITSMPAWVRRRVFQREVALANFSGGLNLRDAPTELANTETPDCMNVTLTEIGGVQKRLGYIKKNPSPFTTAHPPQNLFGWKTAGVELTQCGPDVFRNNGTSSVHMFSTADRAAFAEFAGSVYAIHPVDGVIHSSDGTTWHAIAGSPKGTCLEPWQNRLLCGGDPSNPPRLSASAIGDALNWSLSPIARSGTDMSVTNGSATVTSASGAFTAGDVTVAILIGAVTYHIASVTNSTTVVLDSPYAGVTATNVAWSTSGFGWFNDIREHDSQPLVAIKAASGLDIAGKPGVLVFKNGSSYRVNDPNTGAYQTIDTSVGAASAISVVSLFELTFVLHQTGIYVTNGTAALTLLSGQLQPLFTPTGVAYDQAGLFCAGISGSDNRVHFSFPRAGSTANDLHLELHANLKLAWIMPHTDAASCYATYLVNDEQLHAGSPTVAGQVYQMGVGGNDDGADIACYYQTKWLAPAGGIETRFRRLRVFGRGDFSLYVKRDFDLGPGSLNQVVLSGNGMLWDTGMWDVDVWGPTVYEDSEDFWSLGNGKYIALRLEETSGYTAFEPPLLDTGASPPVGSFAMFSFILQFIELSL